jgi:NAD(P)-dependent dehydrogenase (short-subunit alcohol dehydrogenase family)
MGLLTGKVAIITGAGGGLGRAYALLFAREGAHVIVNDYSVTVDGDEIAGPSLADGVVAEITQAGGSAVANRADVGSEEGGLSILQTALDVFGRVDILVNNAGIVRDSDFEVMPAEDWDRVIQIHLRGTFCVSQPVFAQMVRQGGGGVIVNTTSRSGIRGKTRQANYSAAKGGVIALSNVLALEGKPHGIRVWTISPRAATRAWDFVGNTSAGPMTETIRSHFSADAVALTALYMVSDLSRPHTGKILFASADSVREVRFEAAPKFEPAATTSVYDLVAAIGAGQLLFRDEPEFDRLV